MVRYRSIECVRPGCATEYVPEKTGDACPECGTPALSPSYEKQHTCIHCGYEQSTEIEFCIECGNAEFRYRHHEFEEWDSVDDPVVQAFVRIVEDGPHNSESIAESTLEIAVERCVVAAKTEVPIISGQVVHFNASHALLRSIAIEEPDQILQHRELLFKTLVSESVDTEEIQYCESCLQTIHFGPTDSEACENCETRLTIGSMKPNSGTTNKHDQELIAEHIGRLAESDLDTRELLIDRLNDSENHLSEPLLWALAHTAVLTDLGDREAISNLWETIEDESGENKRTRLSKITVLAMLNSVDEPDSALGDMTALGNRVIQNQMSSLDQALLMSCSGVLPEPEVLQDTLIDEQFAPREGATALSEILSAPESSLVASSDIVNLADEAPNLIASALPELSKRDLISNEILIDLIVGVAEHDPDSVVFAHDIIQDQLEKYPGNFEAFSALSYIAMVEPDKVDYSLVAGFLAQIPDATRIPDDERYKKCSQSVGRFMIGLSEGDHEIDDISEGLSIIGQMVTEGDDNSTIISDTHT